MIYNKDFKQIDFWNQYNSPMEGYAYKYKKIEAFTNPEINIFFLKEIMPLNIINWLKQDKKLFSIYLNYICNNENIFNKLLSEEENSKETITKTKPKLKSTTRVLS